MTKIVDRIDADNFSIEVYEDGDCVFTLPSGGFLQISRDLLARISQRSKPLVRAQGADASASEETSEGQASSADNPEAAHHALANAKQPPKVFRRVTQLAAVEGVPSEWEAVFMRGEEALARHVYVSRGKAREGQLDTPVGQAGRIK